MPKMTKSAQDYEAEKGAFNEMSRGTKRFHLSYLGYLLYCEKESNLLTN